MKWYRLIPILLLLANFGYAKSTIGLSAFQKSASQLEKRWNKIKKKINVTLETQLRTQRDKKRDYDITGYEQEYSFETGYNFTKQHATSIGGSYMIREFENKTKESKNRDYMNEVYIRHRYKVTKFKHNGIADLRVQARYYQTQDPYFKDRFGNDGNYQLRAQFGRPIYRRLYLNKFTSYIRYKKYFLNQNATKNSRDYELRARLSPSYKAMDGLDLAVSITYNHIFEQVKNKENVAVGPSIRYQKGNYAIITYANYQYQETNDEGQLAYNKNAPQDIGYGMVLTAFY